MTDPFGIPGKFDPRPSVQAQVAYWENFDARIVPFTVQELDSVADRMPRADGSYDGTTYLTVSPRIVPLWLIAAAGLAAALIFRRLWG